MTAQKLAKPFDAFAALPAESRLPMPEQSLRESRGTVRSLATTAATLPLRRLLVFAATIAMTVIAAGEMYEVLEVGGLTMLEAVVLGLFVALFAWIAFSFVSASIGFLVTLTGPDHALGIDTREPLPDIAGRNAMLLPTYNENPHSVFARLQAIYESIEATGRGAHFDFFVLSDTTDPTVWIEEEATFLRVRAQTGSSRIYYRHRSKNIARKAGNIAEWITRFGGQYDHMIVLDADSLMEGDTVVRLAAAMEGNPRVGLIQTTPVLLNGQTLFARIQQFAGRVYGPIIARGIAWWHGSEGNYWGHNAIIRVRAFAGQAGLPLLKGRKPFGGHVLSHDFVEAALMRRAGWAIHMAPSLGGSYEECPPSMTDYAVRDRRWCQGNLQHIRVLPARGLHWVSRLHLLVGIGSYVTAPLWLLFLLTGILISLQAQFVRPEYFPSGVSLFPHWPAQDPVRAAWVFAGTMALLIVPKLFGYLALIPWRCERRGAGGTIRAFLSVLLETIVSALMAPIMTMTQSKAVLEILAGRDAGWQAQRRDGVSLRDDPSLRNYATHAALGLVLTACAYAVSLSLLLWMTPVLVGLTLAIPVAITTSSSAAGTRLRKLGLLLTLEERDPPPVAVRTNALAQQGLAAATTNPILRLLQDAELLNAHRRMLPASEARRRGDIDVKLVVALAKIDDAATRAEAVALLDPAETMAVLGSDQALGRLLAKA